MNRRRKSDYSPGCGLERNDNHDSKARPYHCTSKNKAKTWDSKLAKLTKWVALLFVVLTLVLSLI